MLLQKTVLSRQKYCVLKNCQNFLLLDTLSRSSPNFSYKKGLFDLAQVLF